MYIFPPSRPCSFRRHSESETLSLAWPARLAGAAAILTGCAAGAADPTGQASSQALEQAAAITDSTGLCIDAKGGDSADGTSVQLWTCNGTPAQEWTMTSGAIVGLGGKCLDVQWGGTDNGTPVQLWDCNGTPAQGWTLANGALVGIAGKCLDVNAFNSVPGQRLQIWDCNGGSNQQFSTAAAPPPVSPPTNADVTVELTSPTGKTVSPYLYGLSSGAIADNGFALAADATVRSSLHALTPTLMRINADNDVADGATGNWFANAPGFMDPSYRFVIGVGPAFGDSSVSPEDWAARASNLATSLKNQGHEVMFWEVGNENSFGAPLYCEYFNAIADALHAVNPSYAVGGTVADWWGDIDVGTFVASTGDRAGFFDFHSYPTGPSDPVEQVYAKAVGFSDVAVARQALAGSAIADIPMGLLEYNMNGNPGEEPRQATYVGALYTSLLLAQAFASDANFTMAGLWDAVGDSYYGVVGNEASGYDNAAITPQGYYLGYAGQHLAGAEVTAATSLANVQVLATHNGNAFSLQIINYDSAQDRTVSISLAGAAPGSITRWELGKSSPGAPTVSTQSDLGSVRVPSESIVILSGTVL